MLQVRGAAGVLLTIGPKGKFDNKTIVPASELRIEVHFVGIEFKGVTLGVLFECPMIGKTV